MLSVAIAIVPVPCFFGFSSLTFPGGTLLGEHLDKG
jgi:hypothetical protein